MNTNYLTGPQIEAVRDAAAQYAYGQGWDAEDFADYAANVAAVAQEMLPVAQIARQYIVARELDL